MREPTCKTGDEGNNERAVGVYICQRYRLLRNQLTEISGDEFRAASDFQEFV